MPYRSSRIRDVFKEPLIVAFRWDNSIWDVVVYENKKKNKTKKKKNNKKKQKKKQIEV